MGSETWPATTLEKIDQLLLLLPVSETPGESGHAFHSLTQPYRLTVVQGDEAARSICEGESLHGDGRHHGRGLVADQMKVRCTGDHCAPPASSGDALSAPPDSASAGSCDTNSEEDFMDMDTAALIDGLAADSLAAKAFMMEVAVRLGAAEADRNAFVDGFISSLHERLDEHERAMKQVDQFGWHEGARQRIDLLGVTLRQVLMPRARPQS